MTTNEANGPTMYKLSMLTDSSAKGMQPGMRLVELRWKKRKDDATFVPPSARCVIIPDITISVTPAILQDAIKTAFREMQDKICKSIVDDKIEHGEDLNLIEIPHTAITEEGVANYAANDAISNRLSKDTLGVWFDECLNEPLQLALAAIPGITDEKLLAAMKQHKDLVTALASPRANMNEKLATQLLKAVKLAENDKIKNSLTAKLEAFLKPAETVMELGL